MAGEPYQQVQQQTPFGGTNWSGNTVTTNYDPRLLDDFWAQTGTRNFQRDMYGRAAGAAASAIGTDPRTGLPSLSPTTQQTGYDRSAMLAIPGANDFAGQGQRVEDATYDRYTSRLDPQFADRQRALEGQLRDQGFTAGSQGYDDAMRDFNFGRTDAYGAAARDAVTAGGAESSRQLADALRIRGQQGTEAQQDLSNYNTAGNTNFGQRATGSQIGFGQNADAARIPMQWLQTTQSGLPQGTMLPQFDMGLQGIDESQASRNAWMAGLSPLITGALGGAGGGSGGMVGGIGQLIAQYGPQAINWLTGSGAPNQSNWGDAPNPNWGMGDRGGDDFGSFTPDQYAAMFPEWGGDMSWLNDAYG